MEHRVQTDLQNALMTSTVNAFLTPEGLILGAGTTVGNGIEGWAPGAIFVDTDAAAGATLWVNEGTKTTATWAKIGAQPVVLADAESISFGTGADIVIAFDGTQLEFLPATDDTGAVNFGDGTTDMDVKVFLGASTDFVRFDVGNGNVAFDNAELAMGDNDEITFGDAGTTDSSILWDATTLVFDSSSGYQFNVATVGGLRLDDSAIASFTGAANTAGKDIYIESQDGGTGTTVGKVGGLLSIKTGDAGAAAAGNNAGANGGALTITTGAGSAIGTQASNSANGGSGGAITIATGAGAGGGATSGTDGSGGVLTLQTGAKGTGGNVAGIDGTIDLAIGGVIAAKIGNSAVVNYAGASATAGATLYIEGQGGGAGTSTGTTGGIITITAGAAGAAAAGTGNAGGAGGAVAITAGPGTAVGTVASGTANGGAGGSITLTAGAGAGGGDASGTDGNGGDIVLVGGAKGTGGSAAGLDGTVKFGSAAMFEANGTNTVTISNVAPAAVGTATISKWARIKDNAGAEFYIPCWT